jgi:hypothetical protein
LQFLGEKGEEFVKQIINKTNKNGINIIDAFRNRWLPKGKLEKEEYIWEKDNFAKIVYLVMRKYKI